MQSGELLSLTVVSVTGEADGMEVPRQEEGIVIFTSGPHFHTNGSKNWSQIRKGKTSSTVSNFLVNQVRMNRCHQASRPGVVVGATEQGCHQPTAQRRTHTLEKVLDLFAVELQNQRVGTVTLYMVKRQGPVRLNSA